MPRRAKKTCFFVTPIGKTDSPERKRANQIQRHILTEVLAKSYKIVRADELSQPGSITHQIIRLLYDAEIVIADLTGSNANVAYELAVRHAFNKVSIHLIDKSDLIPFDLKDERTIVFNLNDPDSMQECREELAGFIKTISSGKIPYSSPVFRTLGVAAATAKERENFLEKIADQIDSIATDVSSLESVITLSDIDRIDSIGDSIDDVQDRVEVLEKTQEEIKRKSDDADAMLREILQKLS